MNKNLSTSIIFVIISALLFFVSATNALADLGGGSGAPTISSYSGEFNETTANHGAVGGERDIYILNDTFVNAGGTLTEGVHFTLLNKPEGLTPVVTVSSDGSTATLRFTGNATNHKLSDSIDDLGIVFLNGAFVSTLNASGVANSSNYSGVINFFTDGWVIVGLSSFTNSGVAYNSLVLNSDSVPYVTYADGYNSDIATVMKFGSTSWEVVGNTNPSSNTSYYVSSGFDNNNVLYVAFRDLDNANKISVKKFNGTGWDVVGTSSASPDTANLISLKINNNNVPYVAYADGGSNDQLTIKKFDGTNWDVVGTEDFSDTNVSNLSFAIDASNTPYVAYTDDSNDNKIIVMNFNGTVWQSVGNPGLSDGSVTALRMTIGTDNLPVVAYIDDLDNYSVVVKKFNGTAWEEIGSSDFSGINTSDISLSIDKNNVPYVAYSSDSNLQNISVKKFNGTNWELVGEDGFSGAEVYGLQIVISSSSIPYASYVSADDGKLTVRKYIKEPTKYTLNYFADDGGYLSGDTSQSVDSSLDGTTVIANPNTNYQFVRWSDGLTSNTRKDTNISANLSVYAIFEKNSTTNKTNNSSGSMMIVYPTPLANTGSLDFVINKGENITNSNVLNIYLNADPRTTRGYVISLDSGFKNDVVNNLVSTTTFPIPDVPATYIVFLKYYSITGTYSETFSKQIVYKKEFVVDTENVATKKAQSVISDKFTRDLKLGMSGADVKELQKFLNSRDCTIAKTGSGSKGNETDYFGKLTKLALIKFQKEYNISPSLGYFGQITRTVINKNI